ncbi:MAG TPA: hypothetical protein VLH09_00560 [Bryobacteraceae bacterium]|nr:hypothetical protein [Bryobacteraceae bacterium]
MDKFALTKTIEARKLNPRTRVPTGEPAVTIPFGAVIQDLVEDRDVIKFNYLGQPYQCPVPVLSEAIERVQPGGKVVEAASTPVPRPVLIWQEVMSNQGRVYRAKVPGGWLIWGRSEEVSPTFYPDPQHLWDGGSLR